MLHLRSITVTPWPVSDSARFPFNLDLIQGLKELTFTTPVTFFVGENGSGKSTVLEAIACAVGSVVVGSDQVESDASLAAARELGAYFRLVWTRRTRRGFFLRAEDFFGYAKHLAQMRAELESSLRQVDADYASRSALAAKLAKLPYTGELRDMTALYGASLDNQSHGESFIALFQARFAPKGLYLLDEPEAPLSPLRQLAFLSALKQMVAQDAQFIIATHSPIILALPGATIWRFDSAEIRPTPYAELEHVALTKAFLDNPEAFLQHL